MLPGYAAIAAVEQAAGGVPAVQPFMLPKQGMACGAAVKAERDRRNAERRRQTDRRKVNLGSLSGKERRAAVHRRAAPDRRNRS